VIIHISPRSLIVNDMSAASYFLFRCGGRQMMLPGVMLSPLGQRFWTRLRPRLPAK
jgi:hypothetical protein